MKRFLVFLAVMLSWMVQAQPEPAIWRSVLTTNRSVPFGNTGQALFRTANLPYLDWSNIVATAGDPVLSNAWFQGTLWRTNTSIGGITNTTGNAYIGKGGNFQTLAGTIDYGLAFGDSQDLESSYAASIVGGSNNRNTNASDYSFMGGGGGNVNNSGVYAGIVGGQNNVNNGYPANFFGGGTAMLVLSNTGYVGMLAADTSTIDSHDGSDYFTIIGGLNNMEGTPNVASFYQNIWGGSFNKTTNGWTWIIGDHVTNTVQRSVDIGFYNTNKVKIDQTNLHLIGWQKLRMTNGYADGYVLMGTNGGNAVWVPLSSVMVNTNLSEGFFIKTHLGNGTNTTFWQSNVVVPPVVIRPAIGTTTNRFEVYDTNGSPKFVVDSKGRVGINTNLPQAPLHITGTNGPSPYIVQVENPMVVGQTNTFLVTTNGRVGIGNSAPSDPLTVAGQITASANIQSGSSFIHATVGSGIRGLSSANSPGLFSGSAGIFTASYFLNTGGNVGSPSNNLFVAGQLIASNGIIAKVHSSYNTNTTPLQVDAGGGLNPVGCYGALMMNATNIVVCAGAASVYTNVAGTGYTTIVTNGFYGSTADALTNLYAGWYRVTVCASALGQNNQATEWELHTNGISCDLIGMKKTYDAAARMDDLSMSGIVYLPASTRVDFRVQDGGTGGSIAIHRASMTVGTP